MLAIGLPPRHGRPIFVTAVSFVSSSWLRCRDFAYFRFAGGANFCSIRIFGVHPANPGLTVTHFIKLKSNFCDSAPVRESCHVGNFADSDDLWNDRGDVPGLPGARTETRNVYLHARGEKGMGPVCERSARRLAHWLQHLRKHHVIGHCLCLFHWQYPQIRLVDSLPNHNDLGRLSQTILHVD